VGEDSSGCREASQSPREFLVGGVAGSAGMRVGRPLGAEAVSQGELDSLLFPWSSRRCSLPACAVSSVEFGRTRARGSRPSDKRSGTRPSRAASRQPPLPFRTTQHTPPPRPASPETTFPFRHEAALGHRASTLGRHAPFLLLTEFLAGEWRYSATHLSGISAAKHACVVLCFQLPSRCSSPSCAHALRLLSAESDRRTDTNEANSER